MPQDPAIDVAMFYQRAGKICREAEYIVQSLPNADLHSVARTRRQLIAVWDFLDRLEDPSTGPHANALMKECVEALATRLYEFESQPPPPRNAGVRRVRTGRRGQPRFDIDINDVLFQRGIGAQYIDIARAMGVSDRTLRNHLRRAGIASTGNVLSVISDEELDSAIGAFSYIHPFSGVVIVKGFLRSIGIVVPKSRVNESMRRIDPIGTLIR